MQRRVVLFVALAVCLPLVARAHTSSVSYSHLKIPRGGGASSAVEYELKLSSRDLYEALGLERDRDAEDPEILAGEQKIVGYVRDRVSFAGDGRPCDLVYRKLDIEHQNDRFAALRFGVRCPPGTKKLAIDYRLFFDLDPRHASRVTLTRGERSITQEDLTRPTDQDPAANRREWDLAAAGHDKGKGTLDWIFEGMMHIYSGYDHIAFLVGLLLIAAVKKDDDGEWKPRGLRPGVTYVLKIVTAFTVAHSITLITSALGFLSVPSRFVESAIAASIVYVAAENIWLGDPKYRWPLTFGFGLVHGLGFAGALAPMLPPTGVVVPLLELNVGVEIGQLTVVVAAFPILHLLATRGAQAYRRTVILYGSAIVGLFGGIWLIERVFDVKLISQYLW